MKNHVGYVEMADKNMNKKYYRRSHTHTLIPKHMSTFVFLQHLLG